MPRAYVAQPEPAWCLRYAPDTNLAFASTGTASHGAVLGVELEQSLQRESCIWISQRIGSAANPADRADGNRKQRGSRALIGISVGRRSDSVDLNIAG